MNFRARLSLFALETRENPSVPGLDPFGGEAPAPIDPPGAGAVDPVQIAIDAAIAGASATATTTTTTTTTTTADGINSIYNIPLLP